MNKNRESSGMVRKIMMAILLVWTVSGTAEAQVKEAVQMATLSPVLLILTSDSIDHSHKLHFTVSTIGYLGLYMITESEWRAAAITLLLGVAKELIYDDWMNQGTPLWSDMKWNSLGVGQGVLFTISLRL